MFNLLDCSTLCFIGEEFFERSGERYCKRGARLQNGRTVGFSHIADSQKVRNVQI
jgi:hypothetical protein